MPMLELNGIESACGDIGPHSGCSVIGHERRSKQLTAIAVSVFLLPPLSVLGSI